MGSNKVTAKQGLTNLQPYTTVALQRRDGESLLWIGGCLEIKAVGSDTFQTAYEYCKTATGYTRYDIDQISDPTPIQMSARGDVKLQQALYQIWKRSRDTNCLINVLILQRECVDNGRTKDPNFFTRGFWLTGLRATGRWTWGNDTLVGMNGKSPQLTEDQGQFIVGSIEPFMQNEYSSINSALTEEPLSMVIADVGSCASGDCEGEQDGCQVVAYMGSASGAGLLAYVAISYDGGASFTDITGGSGLTADPPYFLAAINGRILLATRDTATDAVQMRVLTLNSTLTGYTASSPTIVGSGAFSDDLGLIGNKPILAPDGQIVWAGDGGEVFKSGNNGGIWRRIANNVSVYTSAAQAGINFYRLKTVGDRIYAVARNVGSTQTIYLYSDDSGVTWTMSSYIVEAMPTSMEIAAAGGRVFVIRNGLILEWTSTGVSTTSLNPTGISLVDYIVPMGDNGNDMLIIASDNTVWRTIDGLSTARQESLGVTLPAGGSAYALCDGANSESIFISGEKVLIKARAEGNLF